MSNNLWTVSRYLRYVSITLLSIFRISSPFRQIWHVFFLLSNKLQFKATPDGDWTADPQFNWSFITSLAGIEQSTPLVKWSIQTRTLHLIFSFMQTVAKLCADANYYFTHSFNSASGSRAFRRALTLWATRVGLHYSAICGWLQHQSVK